jgi:hypothetical protein
VMTTAMRSSKRICHSCITASCAAGVPELVP